MDRCSQTSWTPLVALILLLAARLCQPSDGRNRLPISHLSSLGAKLRAIHETHPRQSTSAACSALARALPLCVPPHQTHIQSPASALETASHSPHSARLGQPSGALRVAG